MEKFTNKEKENSSMNVDGFEYPEDKNKNHPEAQEGEVWICNARGHDFADIELVSKRKGKIAFDVDNNPIVNVSDDEFDHFEPIFAKRDEVMKKAIELGLPEDTAWLDIVKS